LGSGALVVGEANGAGVENGAMNRLHAIEVRIMLLATNKR